MGRTYKNPLAEIPADPNEVKAPDLTMLAAFAPLLNDHHRFMLLQGGRGSGKSSFAVRKIIIRCLQESKSRFLIVRKFQSSLRRTIWLEFSRVLKSMDSLRENRDYTINKGDLTIEINGNLIFFAGLDDPDKLKSMDINAGVVIEEALDITEDDFIALNALLRGHVSTYAQIIMCYNPDRKSSFIFKTWFAVENPLYGSESLIHVSTIEDNYTMPERDKTTLDNIADQAKKTSWRFGQWADSGDLILTDYHILDFDKEAIIGKAQDVIAGVDWGWTCPSTYIPMAVLPNGDIYILDEVYQAKTQTSALLKIFDRVNTDLGLAKGDVLVYAENAEPDRNDLLEGAGFKLERIKKDKKQELAIIKEHKIYVHPECVETIKEIESWHYSKDRDGYNTELPAAGNDHSMDAICYAVRNYFISEKSRQPFWAFSF